MHFPAALSRVILEKLHCHCPRKSRYIYREETWSISYSTYWEDMNPRRSMSNFVTAQTHCMYCPLCPLQTSQICLMGYNIHQVQKFVPCRFVLCLVELFTFFWIRLRCHIYPSINSLSLIHIHQSALCHERHKFHMRYIECD